MAQYIRTYFDNNKTQLQEKYYIVDGMKEGIYKSYHYNRQLYKQYNYVNNKLNGKK